MLALALVAALAWAPAQAPTLAERLGLEGPLDNDTDLVRNAEALVELLAGDKAIAQTIDETTKIAAFEHWRRALIVSHPLDAVAVDERRSISVALAVENRLGTALKRDFRERFEGIAAVALAAAGSNEAALTRVAYEHPFTHSGVAAEVRLFDSAFERGAVAGARAALSRIEYGHDPADESAARAFSARRTLLPSLVTLDEIPKRIFAVTKLALERSIDLGGAAGPSTDFMLEPGFALGRGARIWIQSGERLVALAPDGSPTNFETAKLIGEATARGAWLPGFGDKDRAWLQRPAIVGSILAVALGRARETRGNALAAFDIATGTPRLVWMHHDGERADEAPLPGRLEFQPGPLAIDGLVLAQVLQWNQDGVNADQQRVDGRNTHAWLVAFDIHDGRVVWKRRLASGADRRGRALDRFDQPRSTSVACLPLDPFGDDQVVVCTELGALSRVSALAGALVESYALKRVRHDPDIRPGSGGPFVYFGQLTAVAPADADEFVYVLGKGAPSAVNIPHLDRLVGLGAESSLFALARIDGRSVLQCIRLPSDERSSALPLPAGDEWKGGLVHGLRVLIAAGGSIHMYGTDLRLIARLELPGLENERNVGVWTHESKVYVAGQGRIWVVRVE